MVLVNLYLQLEQIQFFQLLFEIEDEIEGSCERNTCQEDDIEPIRHHYY